LWRRSVEHRGLPMKTLFQNTASLHQRLYKMTVSLTLLASVTACSGAPLQSGIHQLHLAGSSQEKIIGENNLTPVALEGENLPIELRPFVKAIGQLNVGCTATHIGKGLVLTAGHCISTSPRSSSKSCRTLGVVWGNIGGNKNLSVSKCLEVAARTYNAHTDFAVLRVANPPESSIEVDLETQPSALNSNITMLSFPRMRPLEWSGRCAVSQYNDDSVAWKKFLHSCDSESGSSGAVLISTSSLKVIGIHGGASDELNYGMYTAAINELKTLLQGETKE